MNEKFSLSKRVLWLVFRASEVILCKKELLTKTSFCGSLLVFCCMFSLLFVAVAAFSCSFFRRFVEVSSTFRVVHTPVTGVNGSCLFSSLAEVTLESSLVCLFIKLLSLAVAFCYFRQSLNMVVSSSQSGVNFSVFFIFK